MRRVGVFVMRHSRTRTSPAGPTGHWGWGGLPSGAVPAAVDLRPAGGLGPYPGWLGRRTPTQSAGTTPRPAGGRFTGFFFADLEELPGRDWMSGPGQKCWKWVLMCFFLCWKWYLMYFFSWRGVSRNTPTPGSCANLCDTQRSLKKQGALHVPHHPKTLPTRGSSKTTCQQPQRQVHDR